jgi:hypothetical protein
MRRRAFLCTECGLLQRHEVDSEAWLPKHIHCGKRMHYLSDEQAFAAYHMQQDARPQWIARGGHVLRRNSSKKRWVPAVSDAEIADAVTQKANYSREEPPCSDNRHIREYERMARPFIARNKELSQFLAARSATHYLIDILFVSLPDFQQDVFRYVCAYDTDRHPRSCLTRLLYMLFSISDPEDTELHTVLLSLSEERGIPLHVPAIWEYDTNPLSLKRYIERIGIRIK